MSIAKYILGAGLVAAMTLGATAQNLQSVKNYNKMHSNLLAKQNRIQDQIRLEETQRYAADLYEEVEPEPDIYAEGWESGLVNPFKDSDVPATKTIDVRGYVMPLKGNFVTSHYGYRPAFGRNHKGVDLRCPMGDTVRAAFNGRVRLTKYERGGFGFYVIVRHENGLETVYGHLSRFLCQPNQYVKAGQPIALSGSTGRSTGPHLHFETRFMGYAINPEAIFDFENRCTHTDKYTFTKSNYTQSRSYRPSNRYMAARASKSSYRSSGSKSNYRHGGSKNRTARSTTKVRKGDNLSKIAQRNGTTVAKLKKLNGIRGNKVVAGKVLRVR
ncbi:MAG: peptidoglycan DD-metalloendopeptidase family protein [Muribaculaceae bacterium]|nr:peptidoglycan DD-metalloendopeptidase family protein [Muribaculaceae bacterium]